MTTVTVLFICCFIGITVARTDKDIKKWFIEQALECSKEHPITGEEVQMIKKDHKIPDSRNAKCLVACMFRKLDWIDDKGIFNEKNAYKMSEKEYPGDQTKLDNAKKLYDTCLKVNEESVGDDKDRCDRAVLLATCLTENAPKSSRVLLVDIWQITDFYTERLPSDLDNPLDWNKSREEFLYIFMMFCYMCIRVLVLSVWIY